MVQKQKTAPRKIELPPNKAANPAASKAGTAAVNGAHDSTEARVREATAAASAGIAAKRQERIAAPAAKAAAKAVSAPSADFEDLAAVGQENLDACVKCGTIVAKGMELLGIEVVSFAQTAVEANLTVALNILTAKSWHEAIDMQADFARDRLEVVAAETAKFGEISLQVANQALEPIQSRIGAGAEKLFQPLA